MKIACTIENDNGAQSRIYEHFGSAPMFMLVTVDDGEIKSTQAIENGACHGGGGGGCLGVDFISTYGIEVMITGGMGMGAINKFAMRGIKVFQFNGNIEDAVNALQKGNLSAPQACMNHEHHH